MYHYAVNGALDEPYRFRLPFFKAYQDTLTASHFTYLYRRYLLKRMHIKRRRLSVSERECFILLYLLRFFTLQESGRLNFVFRGRGLRLVNFEAVAQNFLRLLHLHHITKPFMRFFSS